MKQSHRFLYAVIPIGHKKLDESIHIWDFSKTLFQDKLDQELEENEDYMAFPDLEEGLTLSVRFVEKQLGKNNLERINLLKFPGLISKSGIVHMMKRYWKMSQTWMKC